MLYELYQTMGINIFQYITFRAGIAFFLGFFICIFAMPYFISWAANRNASQPISEFIESHKSKRNTPTMGGLVFVLSTVIAGLLTTRIGNHYCKVGLACLVIFALIGAKDDYKKISENKNAGISASLKFMLLGVTSVCLSLWMLQIGLPPDVYVPFKKTPLLSLEQYQYVMVAFCALVFLATTNAVNITDGLDGLATVPSICALFSLTAFVYVAGNAEWSRYLLWPKVENSGEIMVLSAALIGSLFGFLWYNCHPAQVFMGDSGSLAVGGFIAFCSIISNNQILLIVIGSIFVIETMSVILQVGSYKMRKKRIFLMAPIHHHFEVKGWTESKIIVRFWIVAILSNIIALISLKVR